MITFQSFLPQPASASKPAPVQATKRPEPAHQHFTAMDDHDGLSEHPPAAVMLLVLGMLVGCLWIC